MRRQCGKLKDLIARAETEKRTLKEFIPMESDDVRARQKAGLTTENRRVLAHAMSRHVQRCRTCII